MKNTKIIALLTAVCLCLPLIAACANDGGETVNTRGPSSADAEAGTFQNADFKNEEFTFLVIQQKAFNKDYYGGNFIDADSLTGATIEDAVYKRNMAVEEKYKVQIIQCIEQSGFPSDLLNTFYMSDDFCFDVIYGWGYKLGSCIPENYFADMYDLPYVDFTQEYWSPSAMDTLTVNDSLYTFINDISMNKLDWAFFLYYNKQVAKDYNVETQFGSPYDLVTEGKWTLDRFLQMVTSVSNDLDGDGKIKPDDVYGIMDLTAVNIARASGISAVEKTTTAPTAFHT